MQNKNNKPSIEERVTNELARIHIAIGGLSHTIERLYEDWKFPVQTMAEQNKDSFKEQDEENRFNQQLEALEKQNRVLLKSVKIAIVGIIITAFASVFDIILRIFSK